MSSKGKLALELQISDYTMAKMKPIIMHFKNAVD